MKLVIDQNCLRDRKEHSENLLRAHLLASPDNGAVITDMAVFEMVKGEDPIYGVQQSLAVLSEFPDQVFCTSGRGELMRRELQDKKAIATPLDECLTKRMRSLLRRVSDFRRGAISRFPLDEARVIAARDATQERLDHETNERMLKGGVKTLRDKLTPTLKEEIRSGRLTQEVYEFVYQSSFIAFSDSVSCALPNKEQLESIFLENCLIARTVMVYSLATMKWFEKGGIEAMPKERITNEMHDFDYVVMSSYFDGILSRETRVNELYTRMKDFFEVNKVSR